MNLSITERFLPLQNKLGYKKQKDNHNPFSANRNSNTSARSITNFTANSQLTNVKKAQNSAIPSFTGINRRVPEYVVNSLNDLITYWNKTSSPYYLSPATTQARQQFCSFLNDVPSKVKREFVEYYKEITGFPDFKKIALKIETEFVCTIKSCVKAIKKDNDITVKVIAAGYDPTCAIGLKKAFPGSCMRNPFIIYKSKMPNFFSTQWQFAGNDVVEAQFYKFFHQKNNQRLLKVEFDKPDGMPTLPQPFLMKDLPKQLKFFDKYDHKIDLNLGYAIDWLKSYKLCKMQERKLDPVEGALYNISLSKLFPNSEPLEIPTKEKRKNAKYLATFIESIRDGKYLIKDEDSMCDLKDILNASPFAQYSNITQIKARKNLIAQGDFSSLPEKFAHRAKLETEFDKMNHEDQFELIKDIIKASYGVADNPKFAKYFKNDENLAKRYQKLDRALLGGIVDENVI